MISDNDSGSENDSDSDNDHDSDSGSDSGSGPAKVGGSYIKSCKEEKQH